MVYTPEDRINNILKSNSLIPEQVKTLKRFRDEESALGRSIKTTSTKFQSLKSIGEFLKKPFEDATKEDFIKYLASIRTKYKQGTFTLISVHLKSFYQWLHGYKKGTYPDCVDWIKTSSNTNHRELYQILTQEEVLKIVSNAYGLRNKALIMILYDTAMRSNEALSLRIKDIHFNGVGGHVTIPISKTKTRKVPLIDSLPYLKQYIDNEHPDNQNPEAWLFVNVYNTRHMGEKLDRHGAYLMIKRSAERAGIKKNVTLHLFRHTKLTEWAGILKEQELKQLAGWTRSSKMAETYVHLQDEDIGNKLLEAKGVIEKKNKEVENKLLPKRCIDRMCDEINPATSKYCHKCHKPLDINAILETNKEIDELKKMVKALGEMVLKREMENK